MIGYKNAIFLAALLIVTMQPATTDARPISYAGGWTGMITNNGDRNGVHLHYSPSPYTSWGYKFEHWRDRDFDFHGLQMNNLLKRWNMEDAQANIYLKSGLGMVFPDNSDHDTLAGFSGLAADWENRRYFVSYENRYTEAGSVDDFFMHAARVGVAPYIGNYGDLHTWLMVEVEHTPESHDPITVTPLVRLFKGAHLAEIGVSSKKEILFNWTIRY